MIRGIDRILLRVPALESAVRFYRDVLGLKLLRQETHVASFHLADHQAELVLHDDPDLPAEAIYYRVDDVRELYKRRDELKLKFTSPPVAVTHGYRAAVKDPFGTVLLLLDRTTASGKDPTTVEDARQAATLFSGIESKLPVRAGALIEAYQRIGRTADDLPYTPHFESLHSAYGAAQSPPPSRAETWRHLLNLRKGGKLPKLGEARSKPPVVTPEERQQLRDMLGDDIGRRDRLPYTDRFDELVDLFNRSRQRPISPHLVWRLVATLAK